MRLRALFGLSIVVACSSYGEQDTPSTPTPTPDGGADAGPPSPSDGGGDATPGPFCESRTPTPFFCADFDDGKPAGYGFEETLGTFAIDTTTSTSAPASLRVTLENNGTAFVAHRFDSMSLTSRIALSLRMRWSGTQGIPVRIDAAQGTCNVDLVKASVGWELQVITKIDGDPDPLDDIALPYYPVQDEWTKIEIVLSKDSQGVVVSLKADGLDSVTARKTKCTSLGIAKLALGLHYGEPGTVSFDDVLLEGE